MERKQIDKNHIFEVALKYFKYSKKEFAKKTDIPYREVLEWKKTGYVPDRAFVLLKKLAKAENHIPKHEPKYPKIKMQITNDLIKKVQVAFWGQNIDVLDAIKKARKGNQKYLTTIVNNIWTKDVVRPIGAKNILKHLKYNDKMDKRAADAVLYVAKLNV